MDVPADHVVAQTNTPTYAVGSGESGGEGGELGLRREVRVIIFYAQHGDSEDKEFLWTCGH
jgi:hypothetical protein